MTDPVFFEPSRRFSAAEIAALTGASLADPDTAETMVSHVAALADGGEGALVYLDAKRGSATPASIRAAVLICTAQAAANAPSGVAVIVSERPQADFATITRLMFPSSMRPGPVTGETGISPGAFVDPTAMIEEGAIIEAGAIVSRNAEIGRGTVIGPNTIIGPDCRVGRDCSIGPLVSILYCLIGNGVVIHGGVQIGQDGFGYAGTAAGPEKLPQIGRVVIQDNVEIGANTTIDRGALSDTVIGESTKIDNLVQIAHNVRIGRGCIVAGHCGLSGSVTLGDGVMLGGRVGIADHISVGAGAAIAAASGVMVDVPPKSRWAGMPARPVKDFFREVAVLRRLSEERKLRGKADG